MRETETNLFTIMNFVQTKHVREHCLCLERKGKIDCVCAFCILFSLIQLTLCDRVNVMLDEFTGCVRALVTCAALWSWIIRLMLMLHVGYPQFHLIQKISEVAAEVGVLWPPQRLIHLHTIKLYWLWLLPFLCVHIVLYLCSPLSFCCCLVLSQCVLCQSISCSHWPFISLIHVSSQRTGSLRGSPPHVQCDQYKGQGPCTQTPPLTKREGLKAGETAWWVKVRVCACLWVCVYSTCVCVYMCICAWERGNIAF